MGASTQRARRQASLRRKNGIPGLIELHGALHHDKHIAMLMKINADLDTVSAAIMKLLQEVHS